MPAQGRLASDPTFGSIDKSTAPVLKADNIRKHSDIIGFFVCFGNRLRPLQRRWVFVKSMEK